MTALAKSKTPGEILIADLQTYRDRITAALPANVITYDRFFQLAVNSFRKNPAIINCSRTSIFSAIMEAAILGLEPDGTLGLAYLVPYGQQCQLIIGYKGFTELAARTGRISNVRSHVVRAGDQFEYELGLKPTLRHKPLDVLSQVELEARMDVMRALAGNTGITASSLVAAYCVIDRKDGSQGFEVVMRDYIMKIRAASKSSKHPESPWNKWEDAMWRKSAIKQGLKYEPMSPEDKLGRAMAHDERTFRDFGSSPGEVLFDDDQPTVTQVQVPVAAPVAQPAPKAAASSNGSKTKQAPAPQPINEPLPPVIDVAAASTSPALDKLVADGPPAPAPQPAPAAETPPAASEPAPMEIATEIGTVLLSVNPDGTYTARSGSKARMASTADKAVEDLVKSITEMGSSIASQPTESPPAATASATEPAPPPAQTEQAPAATATRRRKPRTAAAPPPAEANAAAAPDEKQQQLFPEK